jgi:hypothetical protein
MPFTSRSPATPRGRVAALIVSLAAALVMAGLLLRAGNDDSWGATRRTPAAGEGQALAPDESERDAEARVALPAPATGESHFVALVRIRPRRARMTSARPISDSGEVDLALPPRRVASVDSCEAPAAAPAAAHRQVRAASQPHDPVRAD